MQGLALKSTVIIIATFFTALTYATPIRHSEQKTQTKATQFNTGAGCMACHQSDIAPSMKKKD